MEAKKAEISELIGNYRFNLLIYNQNRYLNLFFVIPSFVWCVFVMVTELYILMGFLSGWVIFLTGFFLFIKRNRRRKKLGKSKHQIIGEIKSVEELLSLEEILDYRVSLYKVSSYF